MGATPCDEARGAMRKTSGVAIVVVTATIAATSVTAQAASDPAPAEAFTPIRLYSLPRQALVQCQLARQLARCPTRLPRATIAYRRGAAPPPLYAERYRPGMNGHALLVGMSFSYGAPWEPGSGPDWRRHLWRNRPCCFFHFELWRSLRSIPPFPEQRVAASLAGRRGDLAAATGFGLACGRGNGGVFFCNHMRFRWREHGKWFVATLHRFGTQRETRSLLARIVASLRPR